MVTSCNRVWLVRHGQTRSNLERRYAGRGGEPLTAEGRGQIGRVSALLEGEGVSAVWSSSIARARESASILAERLRVAVRVDPRLDELLLGPWEGLTEDEVAERYPVEIGTWHQRPDELALEGRETLAQVQVRMGAVIQEAVRRPEPVVLVTHVAPIRVAALTVLGLPLRLYKRVNVGNADAILLQPADGSVRRHDSGSSLADELGLSTREHA